MYMSFLIKENTYISHIYLCNMYHMTSYIHKQKLIAALQDHVTYAYNDVPGMTTAINMTT